MSCHWNTKIFRQIFILAPLSIFKFWRHSRYVYFGATLDISILAPLSIFKFWRHSRYGSPTWYISHQPQNHSIIGPSGHPSRAPLLHCHWLICSLLFSSSLVNRVIPAAGLPSRMIIGYPATVPASQPICNCQRAGHCAQPCHSMTC